MAGETGPAPDTGRTGEKNMNWPSLKAISCDADTSARSFRNRWDRAFEQKEDSMTEAQEQFTKAIAGTQAEVGREYAESIASQLSAAKEISWIWQQRGIGGSFPENTERNIAVKADVLAERERCANWVETLHPRHDITQQAYDVLLQKIRSGE